MMKQIPENAELFIGRRVKAFRLQRNLTLEQLGQRSNLTRSFLSKLENGKASPSIPALIRIANALEIKLNELLDELIRQDENNLVVVRAADRRVVARGGSSFGYSYEALAHLKSATAEPFIVRFTRGRKPPKPFTHEGYEFNYVLSGQVEFVYGDKVSLLQAGDSAYYVSSVPHYGIAKGSKEARVLSMLVDNKSV
ncbi:MAG: XRE family transcriptional regulator [Chloroflexi bacterium]|nr:XRE family transcriptional regulator [Chloroflexota bacterium]